MNLIFRKNFKNAVERVLHVPHNYTGGILEMTFVLDYALSKECAVSMTKEIAAVLRSHSQVFQNVRLNLLHWKENEVLVNQVVPISMLQLGRGLENYESLPGTGSAAGAVVLDEERTKKNLQPFLGRKSIFLCVQEDGECVSPEIVMGAEILSKI